MSDIFTERGTIMGEEPPPLPEMPPPLPPTHQPPLMALPVLDGSAMEAAAVNCPLCGYDLRGLTEQRCPECGHAFDLDELLRDKATGGEWRFENARKRLIRSFVLTAGATMRPFNFWGELRAAHTIVPSRLFLWARIWIAIAGLSVAIALVLGAIVNYVEVQRALAAAAVGVPRFGAGFVGTPSFDPTFSGAITRVITRARYDAPLWLIFAIMIWPVMAVLASQLFGHTLRRASIHRGHLWRCVLYAWPMMALPCVLYLMGGPVRGLNAVSVSGMPQLAWQLASLWGIAPLALFMMTLSAILSTIHLIAAHVRYLRLPQAAAQAILVQVVAWLSIVTIIHLVSLL